MKRKINQDIFAKLNGGCEWRLEERESAQNPKETTIWWPEQKALQITLPFRMSHRLALGPGALISGGPTLKAASIACVRRRSRPKNAAVFSRIVVFRLSDTSIVLYEAIEATPNWSPTPWSVCMRGQSRAFKTFRSSGDSPGRVSLTMRKANSDGWGMEGSKSNGGDEISAVERFARVFAHSGSHALVGLPPVTVLRGWSHSEAFTDRIRRTT